MPLHCSHRLRSGLAVAAIAMLAGCTILDRLSQDPEPFPEDAASDASVESDASDAARDATPLEDAADSAAPDARDTDAADGGLGADAARDTSADAEDGG